MDLAFLDKVCQPRNRTESSQSFGSLPNGRLPAVQKVRSSPRCEPWELQRRRPSTSEQSRVDRGEVQVRSENLELLKAIAASKVFTEFECAFTEATGLPLALEPVESLKLSFHKRNNQGAFCSLMAGENRTCGACLQCQAEVAQAAAEGPHTRVCYAGLCETVVPLRLGTRLIGFLRTGQLFHRKPGEAQFRRIFKLLSSWGMKVDQEVLREAYFEAPVVPQGQHAAAVKLLSIFAEHLAILSNQILIQRDNAEPPMITKAKAFIREHHAEELSLSRVAQAANSSRFHFCKLFKQATGLNFTKFVACVRIEKSKALLSNPQIRVSEVAYEVGFQSLNHFNRMFQKILGQSPSQYRRTVQNGKCQPSAS